MNEQKKQKLALLICTCSGACPSMANIDFWTLSERIRLELGDKIEFMALHPRLCEEDGERLMKHILTDDITFITSACAEKKQQKLLRDGFASAGIEMDSKHWQPIVMANENTNEVFDRIKYFVENGINSQEVEA